jgi:glyoxalase-like protein
VSRLELDHVLFAVRDLAAAAASFEKRHGLVSVEGGRHPGWGTANRIVPLGSTYLELIAVVDAAEARSSPFGAWVAEAASDEPQLLGWAARTDDLDGVADRNGLTILGGSRRAPDGALLRWRTAGFERATTESCFPFFIEWSPETRFPGLAAEPRAVEIRELRLVGDERRLADWLGGDHGLPIVVRPGEPAVESLVLSGRDGRLVL